MKLRYSIKKEKSAKFNTYRFILLSPMPETTDDMIWPIGRINFFFTKKHSYITSTCKAGDEYTLVNVTIPICGRVDNTSNLTKNEVLLLIRAIRVYNTSRVGVISLPNGSEFTMAPITSWSDGTVPF